MKKFKKTYSTWDQMMIIMMICLIQKMMIKMIIKINKIFLCQMTKYHKIPKKIKKRYLLKWKSKKNALNS